MWKIAAVAVVVLAAGAWALTRPVGGDAGGRAATMAVAGMPLTDFSADSPTEAIDLLFVHHSVGEQLLASRGEAGGRDSTGATHPNGGGLRALLIRNRYRLHTATYGSALGEHTDLFDWLPKFRDRMDQLLATRDQDQRLPAGETNRVVMFKSCFPNSHFAGEGSEPGNPAGPELTEANARAALTAVRAELARRPDVLFVYLTAPPQTPRTWTEPAWKWLVKRGLGRPSHQDEYRQTGATARRFNNWVKDPAGWLKGYPHRNVVVFDLFDILTDHGASDFLRYTSGDGSDSHPSSEGNSKVAPELVSFLNRAVRYAGLVK